MWSWVCCCCVKGVSPLFCVRHRGCVNYGACDWFDGADELCHWKVGIGDLELFSGV